MSTLDLNKVRPIAAGRIRPFLDEILDKYGERIHSIHITGTALTDDFDEKVSDLNSVVVLKEMDLKFLELIAPLGKKYGKRKVAAPLIMTPHYIMTSLDVFPVEFLNFRLIHMTVFGEDIFNNLEIRKTDLRHQSEREIKSKLIWLRQGYIASQGDRKILTEKFVNSISDFIPLFRGIIHLFGQEPPLRQGEVITELHRVLDVETDVFAEVLTIKHEKASPRIEELNTIFKDFYTATEKIGNIIDEIRE